jgi:hypothetical protein
MSDLDLRVVFLIGGWALMGDAAWAQNAAPPKELAAQRPSIV